MESLIVGSTIGTFTYFGGGFIIGFFVILLLTLFFSLFFSEGKKPLVE